MDYFSNHILDTNQILNLDKQTIVYKTLKQRLPTMKDDLKILKVEYISNHLLDHTQILNLDLQLQVQR